MKFTPFGRAEGFAWTSRKLANAKKRGERAAQREQDRYPLLADQAPEAAPFEADAEAKRRDDQMRRAEKALREFHSRVWRESRKDDQAANPCQREAVRAAWIAWTGPRTSVYFRYIVDLHTGVQAQRSEAFTEHKQESRAEVFRLATQQKSLELVEA